MALLFFTSPVTAHSPTEDSPQNSVEVTDLVAYAKTKAREAGVSPTVVVKVIECESQWVVDARGDSGHSRGLVQIHDQYHPDVSDAQADDPEFAIGFLVDRLSKGEGHLWTCYRGLK